jgi:HEPN domain-containing protein
VPGADLEAFCFHAQQAAEKAIKGVLLSRGIRFPYVHDLGALLSLAARHGVLVPDEIAAADRLTDYAVLTRYPVSDASRRTSTARR